MQILKPHVSLNVSNVDASVAFYEKAFGIAATKRDTASMHAEERLINELQRKLGAVA